MRFPFFKVSDRSMEPTVKSGDYVLVSKLSYIMGKPKVHDIVILKHPSKNIFLIKRISKINGKWYFVTGDNAPVSTDSRTFGPVNQESIVGKVISVIRS